MKELDEPVTGHDVVNLLTWVVIEVVTSTTKSTQEADERLEDIAGSILDVASSFPGNVRVAPLLKGLASNLIQTEQGAG